MQSRLPPRLRGWRDGRKDHLTPSPREGGDVFLMGLVWQYSLCAQYQGRIHKSFNSGWRLLDFEWTILFPSYLIWNERLIT